MSISLKVRRIGTSKYDSAEFAILSLYFPDTHNAGQLVYALLKCKIYFIEGLQANLLVYNNILSLERIVINIGKKSILIRSCRVTIAINAK